MHLCVQAVRHVGFDCTQGSWVVLQRRCKSFVSRGYQQCSQAAWGELSVCLFQGEIGDRSCLLGMLLVMRSQETLPSSFVFLFSSLVFVSLFLLFLTVVLLFFTQSTSLYLLDVSHLLLVSLYPKFYLNSFSHLLLLHFVVFSSLFILIISALLLHLCCLPVCVRACACVNARSLSSICALAVLNPSPASLPRSSALLPAKH